jgi:hypothetical protein
VVQTCRFFNIGKSKQVLPGREVQIFQVLPGREVQILQVLPGREVKKTCLVFPGREVHKVR